MAIQYAICQQVENLVQEVNVKSMGHMPNKNSSLSSHDPYPH